MKLVNQLKLQAEKQVAQRGHRARRWDALDPLSDPRRGLRFQSHCTCGAFVTVDADVEPPVIQGTALEQDCTDKHDMSITYLKTNSPISGRPMIYAVTDSIIRLINGRRDVEEALRRYGRSVAIGTRLVDGGLEWVDPRTGLPVPALRQEIENAQDAASVLAAGKG